MSVKGACPNCGSTIKDGDKSGRCGKCGALHRR
jgi:ribosomal protein S27AE